MHKTLPHIQFPNAPLMVAFLAREPQSRAPLGL
jgi:hypothetical protein